TFTFVAKKLLAWRGKEEKLEKDRNPFAVFVLAHLQTLATEDDEDERAGWKERLMKNVVARQMDAEDRREWLRLIDWLMELPRERNRVLWQRMWTLIAQKEDTVPFVDYFQEREQEAEKRGLLKGIQIVLHMRLPEHEKAMMARVEEVNDP